MFIRSVLPRIAGILIIQLATMSGALAAPELTLAEAERLALEHAPWLAHHRTNVDAAAERAVYEGRLPDPQLVVGALNVPVDTYKFNQEDMTMTMVGIRQSFPPGDTLKLKEQRAEKELTREQVRVDMERRNLLRQVRQTWIELYFQQQSLNTLEELRRLARKQLEAAEARYRAAQEMQQTVLKARQALARVHEREPMLRAQASRLQAQLARWVGEAAYQPLPSELPSLPVVSETFDHTRHPEWLAAQYGLEQARIEVEMARQEYKPGWMFDLSYGFRRPMPDGTERPDMVTAMVTLDVPIFREKRQDRRLAEKQAMETGAHYEIEDKRRELEVMYRSMRAEFEALVEREKIFVQELLPATRRESQVTVAGFARDQAENREALMKAFDTELEYTRLRADRAKAQAELLYLTGEPQP
ncbi:MAG: TolC family protein [Sulfuricaulis sp.]|uniref:TolC family protein n=1 Tax=Sulfuricaulis sp. TaxID=2003553 RepID=UPI0025CEFECD|nr:TolC family protein [Sulfuricaulis sp.]MCR4347625.1 TolC family protein [Sulfuricaulis sp.]